MVSLAQVDRKPERGLVNLRLACRVISRDGLNCPGETKVQPATGQTKCSKQILNACARDLPIFLMAKKKNNRSAALN